MPIRMWRPPSYLRGVNLAGGEFDDTAAALPGVQGQHYAYNGPALAEYVYGRGHRVARLPFKWERVQHVLSGELDATGVAELRAAIQVCADAGLVVIPDMHNYGKYRRLDDVEVKMDAGITQADYNDVWTRLVQEFADMPAIVGWGLMNEPNNLPDTGGVPTWPGFAQAAVYAIRTAGETRDLYVSGNHWGGAQGWDLKNEGGPWVNDPGNALVYEAHYYLAENNAGAYPNDYATVEADAISRGWTSLLDRVTDELTDFTDWCTQHRVRGFVGEIGWPYDAADAAAWNALGEALYDILDAAEIGATYWATGTRWNPAYRLQPYAYDDTKTVFTPNAQAAVIEAHPSAIPA